MKYAVIQIAGKQLKVAEGDSVTINRMDAYNPVVLAYSQDDALEIGNPVLEGVTVSLTQISESKVKTIVSRYKSKARYRKSTGHKQPLVTLKVESISKGAKSKRTAEPVETSEKTETAPKVEKAKKLETTPKTEKPKTSTKKEANTEKAK